jgi:DNA invertase Pin-like site-specific DNA recombinase
MATPRKLRCAIYTRKSSEEGLDQDFTSLDAQREACAAYIQSQRHEGWVALPTRYDDGGYSGGTLERPAIRQLLTDIDEGRVDLIVVYKIDRLTRALNDFAKIVERLDARSASFVSVTQSFNTTTSMGRLTLNVLLSFAQFEREVTGERIRDKISASKKKGMWMGGFVPLGYAAIDRQLVVQAEEAKIVQRIFDLYLQHKNIAEVQRALREEGVVSKPRPESIGRGRGGVRFSSGALHHLLSNPIYCGMIRHKGTTYPGQHPSIISEDVWRESQAIALDRRTNAVKRVQHKNPLLGLLSDEAGRRYIAVHTTKGGRRYRYYVSQPNEDKKGKDVTSPSARLPATALEEKVLLRLQAFLRDPGELMDAGADTEDDSRARQRLVKAASVLASGTLHSLRPLLKSVIVAQESIAVGVDRTQLRTSCGFVEADAHDGSTSDPSIVLTIAVRLFKTGHELRLVMTNPAGSPVANRRDAKLVKLLARGRGWYEELTSGRVTSIRDIAQRENLSEAYVSRVFQGALLAPKIVEQVIKGTQPVTLTVESLRKAPALDWATQYQQLGIVAR